MSFNLADDDLRKRVIEKAKEEGINMDDLLAFFLRGYVEDRFFVDEVCDDYDDTVFTEEDRQTYLEAKRDFDNGVNIVSFEDLKKKYGFDDVVFIEEDKKDYLEAKRDLENGVNIVSQEEIFRKYL